MRHTPLRENRVPLDSDHIPKTTTKPIPSHLRDRRGVSLTLSLSLIVSQDECRALLIPSPSNLLELTMKMMETRLVK